MTNLMIWPNRCIHLVRDVHECDTCKDHTAHIHVEAGLFLQGQINSAVMGNPSALADLRDLANRHSFLHNVHNVPDSKILEHVACLLETRRLIAVECTPIRDSWQVAPVAAAPGAESRRPRPVANLAPKTWIEIELLTEDRKPVPYEKYRIKVPEGFVAEGALDANGRARIDGIDPGICEVSFPEIDALDVRQA
jgi:hypothetical protein